MKICIIEPHCDDIILSCPELLYAEQFSEIIVITCCNDQDRSSDIYRQKINSKISAITIPVPEIGSGFAGSFHSNRALWAPNVFGIFKILEHYWWLFKNLNDFDQVFLPWGIKHPHHITISMFFRQRLAMDNVRFYMDRPYYDVAPELADPEIDMQQIMAIETPNIDRNELMQTLFDSKYWVRYMEIIKDSKYINGGKRWETANTF